MQDPTSSPSTLSLSLFTCLGLVAGLAACGDDDEVPPALRADLRAVLDDAVANQVTPGALVHVETGDGDRWSAAAGIADLGANRAMSPDDRFRAGSMLKTLVATAVLQTVEAGELSLDDRLTELLPPALTDRIPNAAAIDVAMLLGHRSGVAEWVTEEVYLTVAMDPSHVFSLDEVLDLVADRPAVFPPGEGFGYSNTNYNLLAEILERVTGRSWRDIVRDDVIAAARLDDTFLPEPGDIECPGCARGYIPIDGQLLDFTEVDPSMAGASGGHALISTTADLSRFLRAVLEGDLFEEPTTLAAMLAFRPASDPEAPVTGYGFGVMALEFDGVTIIGHMGGTAGYAGYTFYLPETDRYLSGVINVSGDLGAVLAPIIERTAE